VHSVSCSLTTSNNSQRLNVSDQPAIINEERTLNIFVRPSATLVDATNARNVSQPLKRLIPWHNSRAAASADTVSADEELSIQNLSLCLLRHDPCSRPHRLSPIRLIKTRFLQSPFSHLAAASMDHVSADEGIVTGIPVLGTSYAIIRGYSRSPALMSRRRMTLCRNLRRLALTNRATVSVSFVTSPVLHTLFPPRDVIYPCK